MSTVIEIFERTASRASGAPALCAHGETLNYVELQGRAQRLAASLLGELGKLHLAGTQLTPGYWQAPELDAEKFVMLDGVRWYRTGDLARLGDDGYHFAGCGHP